MEAYSRARDARDPHKLPDVWVTYLTPDEVVAGDDDLLYEYSKLHEFRLCFMNRTVYERMVERIVEDRKVRGGYFWCYAAPGCLPDSPFDGPYRTPEAAVRAARRDRKMGGGA